MGARTRHDLKTHWGFSMPQLGYITVCGCVNRLAMGRAEDSQSLQSLLQSSLLLCVFVFGDVCVYYVCVCVCLCLRVYVCVCLCVFKYGGGVVHVRIQEHSVPFLCICQICSLPILV